MTDTRAGKSYISAQQVAELAGVSRSAVSRTFTEGASVSPKTREKVLQAAQALGYHVNHLARGLIHDRSNIVCLIGADLDTPFQASVVETLTRKLQQAGKVAMMINTSGKDGNVEQALRQTLNYRADATIVLSGQPDRSLIETCLGNGQHVILVNRDDPFPGPEIITVNNRQAARSAFDLLHDAGCRNIAVVASGVATPSLVTREDAFVARAKERGLTVRALRHGPTAYDSGKALAEMLLSGPDRPDGVFCVTDLIACGFMDAARHSFGLKVPDDLSVVGFDDIEQAKWSSYRLTTFRQPVDAMTSHLAWLIDQPAGLDASREPTHFEVEPVWRDTVRRTK